MPYRRWAPPKAVIEAFESEGFIWGGNWTLWDNMHFEYRPELLYIRDFVLKAEFNEFIAQNAQSPYQTPQIETKQPDKKIPQRLAAIFKMAELIKFTSSFSRNILSFYGINDKTEEDNFEKEENQVVRRNVDEFIQNLSENIIMN